MGFKIEGACIEPSMNHEPSPEKTKNTSGIPSPSNWNGKRTRIFLSSPGEREPIFSTPRGRRYLDGVSSLWCNVHGHQVPAIDRAILNQLKKIAHSTLLGASNEPAILLAEKLIEWRPGDLTRVFYSDSGSEANEIAAKMAFQYWQQAYPPRRNPKIYSLRSEKATTVTPSGPLAWEGSTSSMASSGRCSSKPSS